MVSARRSAAEAGHDGREKLAHLVSGSARHGVAGFVAYFREMITHVLDGQPGTVEALCPADEEARNVSRPNGIDLPRHRTVTMRQERGHRGHECRVELLKILAHKVIEHG